MVAIPNENRRFTLKARPSGMAGREHFDADSVGVRQPDAGEVLLETLYLSVDPAMRVWMNENPGYIAPVGIGEVMRGGGVGRVLASGVDGLKPGDVVQGSLGWQTHPTLAASTLTPVDPGLGEPLDWLGALGMTGLTAYFGILDVGRIRPGETVLVSAAAGAVGLMVGQIAKRVGCRVVGIAGGPEKCAMVTGELGMDAAVDYKATDGTAAGLTAAIAEAAPEGVDVYYDNVAGPTLDAALANLRLKGRVVICGRISQTAADELYGIKNVGIFIGKRARMEGFVVFDYADQYAFARRWLAGEMKAGRIRQKMHVIDGLDTAPDGLGMLFRGENKGKLVVKVAD